jgi:two-component system, OmpR family, response regulator VicR
MDARTVVYIEDEPEMIDLVRLILGRKGYQVLGASNGADGLDLILRTLPDLILMDLMMPGMDGRQVHARLKANPSTCKIPIVVVTAKQPEADSKDDLQVDEVDDYIYKPFSPQEILAAIEKVITRRKEWD